MSTYEKAVKLFQARPELFEDAKDTVSFLTENELETQCNDLLDDTLPDVAIGQYSYAPSSVLAKVDPIAHRQEILAYIDTMDVVEIAGLYFDQNEMEDFIEEHTESEVVCDEK